jgi:hypothetical protein
MRELVPAWPPGIDASTTVVDRPSEAPYTAAASPAGPPPTIARSQLGESGSVANPNACAMRAYDGSSSRFRCAET